MILKKPGHSTTQKTIFSGAIIFLLLLLAPEIQSQTLHVNKNSGEHSVMELNTIQKLTFSDGNLNVFRKSEEPMEFKLNEILHLTFSDLSSGIEMLMNQKENNLVVFPNPVKNELYIRLSPMREGSLQVKLISLDGKIIFVKKLSSTGDKNKYQIDVSFLEQGLYFCQIMNNQFSNTIKFIKK